MHIPCDCGTDAWHLSMILQPLCQLVLHRRSKMVLTPIWEASMCVFDASVVGWFIVFSDVCQSSAILCFTLWSVCIKHAQLCVCCTCCQSGGEVGWHRHMRQDCSAWIYLIGCDTLELDVFKIGFQFHVFGVPLDKHPNLDCLWPQHCHLWMPFLCHCFPQHLWHWADTVWFGWSIGSSLFQLAFHCFWPHQFADLWSFSWGMQHHWEVCSSARCDHFSTCNALFQLVKQLQPTLMRFTSLLNCLKVLSLGEPTDFTSSDFVPTGLFSLGLLVSFNCLTIGPWHSPMVTDWGWFPILSGFRFNVFFQEDIESPQCVRFSVFNLHFWNVRQSFLSGCLSDVNSMCHSFDSIFKLVSVINVCVHILHAGLQSQAVVAAVETAFCTFWSWLILLLLTSLDGCGSLDDWAVPELCHTHFGLSFVRTRVVSSCVWIF